MNVPWSSKHKHIFRGCQHSLSNSFAEPLTNQELVEYAMARGDQAVIDEYHNHKLTYTPNGGSADLRSEIAKLYNSPQITADNIMVCAGGQVALQTAAFALLRAATAAAAATQELPSKDGSSGSNSTYHSIVFTPGYQSTIEAPLQAGSRITKIRRRASDQWQINMQHVRDAIQPDTKLILLNEPYNPAGTLMTKEAQQELVSIADEHDIIILCDEVYRFLEHKPEDRLPAMAECYRKGLSVVAMSKPWGGCGITIGWLAFHDLTMRQPLLDALYFGTACPSRASELQAIMTLRASDEILERNLPILRTNLSLLQHVIERKYPDLLEWVKPTAGAIAFVKFKGPLSTEELGAQLAQRSISIKPAFCFSDGVISPDIDYFRVGYGESMMPKALNAFVEFLEEHKETWRATMNAN